MSFESVILDLTGSATDAFDVKATVRRCFFYDLDGYPIRLWDGHGVLITAGDVEWLGTIDANGQNHHISPATQDVRDGASPRYEFTIPYLDEDTYSAFKADQSLIRGRDLHCYQCVVQTGEGLRPQTALWHLYSLKIQGAEFSESYEGNTRVRRATALARGEYGRSHAPFGFYTATHQKERARVAGVGADTGCDFVAGLANRTYVIQGN